MATGKKIKQKAAASPKKKPARSPAPKDAPSPSSPASPTNPLHRVHDLAENHQIALYQVGGLLGPPTAPIADPMASWLLLSLEVQLCRNDLSRQVERLD